MVKKRVEKIQQAGFSAGFLFLFQKNITL